ncbi:MAG TPA: hypothetical protein VH206_01280 [Xanthobacteraceae bacterium]|jgi:hypothetical protein|nr:hypothetical protein [Xanthobacteraceae bacterium]
MNMDGSTPRQDKKPFRKALKTSSRVYGEGRVYFSDGKVLFWRKHGYFDIETGEHDYLDGVSCSLREGVAVTFGFDTKRKDAIVALRRIIRKLTKEITN